MEPMWEPECSLCLSQCRTGHLGLADKGRSYVVPVFYAYDGGVIYFHSHQGLKDDYIDTTEEACFAVTRVQSEDAWESVLAFGKVEKVTSSDEQLAAMDALLHVPMPPEFGFSKHGEPKRSGKDMVIWRLKPTRLSGRKSVRPEAGPRAGGA